MAKGRKQGQVKQKTTIKDDFMEPYYIEFDGTSYDVLGDNKTYHCTSLSYALTKIRNLKIRDKEETMDLKSYIDQMKGIESQIYKIVNL